MKILHINSVCGVTGTGRIVVDLCREAVKQGHQAVIAYGEHKFQNDPCGIDTIEIGSLKDCNYHAVLTRLFDLQGFGSRGATRKLLEKIDQYQPDVIHLHNLHGYYLHMELLFKYIKDKKIKTVWTLHDCWAFTGHCVYFEDAGCMKWEKQCDRCPLKKQYPASLGLDNSRRNYLRKKKAFTGVEDMTLLVPSKWLAERVKRSFLKEYPLKVIYNGIDLEAYRPLHGDLRKRYGLENKYIILGVANVWTERKGLKGFLELAQKLDNKYRIVLVGLNRQQLEGLPDNVLGFTRTDTVDELAQFYTAADVFLNLSTEETFGLTIAEAIACGTYPIAYENTACAEIVELSFGKVVPRDLVAVQEAIVSYCQGDKPDHMEQYASFFSKKRFAKETLKVYEE